jgi:poly(3-hydroxybutyrate) depolymerase
VIFLHGYGGTGDDDSFGLAELAQREGFIFSAPNALPDANGMAEWQPSDVTFLARLIAMSGTDARRVYLVGFSLGAVMALDFACKMPSLANAVVSISGTRFLPMLPCAKRGSVSTLLIHGDADEAIRYAGGIGSRTKRRYLSAMDTAKAVARTEGCLRGLRSYPDRSVGAALVHVMKGVECRNSARVELWTVPGGKHEGIRDPEFTSSLWSFLDRPNPMQR